MKYLPGGTPPPSNYHNVIQGHTSSYKLIAYFRFWSQRITSLKLAKRANPELKLDFSGRHQGGLERFWSCFGRPKREGNNCVFPFLIRKNIIFWKPKNEREYKPDAYWPLFLGVFGAAWRANYILKLDFSGRPQGAPSTAQPRDTFPAIGPHIPRMKYLPGGTPPPAN